MQIPPPTKPQYNCAQYLQESSDVLMNCLKYLGSHQGIEIQYIQGIQTMEDRDGQDGWWAGQSTCFAVG